MSPLLRPSSQHHYQPGWTLVAAGQFKFEDTTRDEKSLIPKGVTWIQDAVVKLDPDNNAVLTQDGILVKYDYLVVCPGIQLDWHKIKGLPEALGKDGVTQQLSPRPDPSTPASCWKPLRAVLPSLPTPTRRLSAVGHPKKIMYMADDAFKRPQRCWGEHHSHVLHCNPQNVCGAGIFCRAGSGGRTAGH